MMCKLTLRAALLSSVCLLPLSALGADLGAAPAAPAPTTDNEVDLGVGGIGGTNTGQYGRYNGFTEQGVDGLFGFSSVTRDNWDSGGTSYYIFNGSNLNFQFGDNLGTANYPTLNAAGTQIVDGQIKNFKDSTYSDKTHNDLGPDAALSFSVGNQGHWSIDGSYNSISYTGNIIDSIYKINGATGSLNPGLTQWGGAGITTPGTIFGYNYLTPTTASGITTPAFPLGAEQPVQTGTRRDIFRFAGSYSWDNWTLTGAVREEHKEGRLEESFDGAFAGTAFTLPVDYDTQRYDLTLAYNTPQYQAQFAYFLSNFVDHYSGVTLPSPLSGANCTSSTASGTGHGLCAQASPYQQTALYATPPSNWANYATAMIGYNVTPETRINANGRVGLELQNDTFPANTADPSGITYSGVVGVPLAPPNPGSGVSAGGTSPGGFTLLNSLGQGTGGTTALGAVAEVYQGNLGISSTPLTNLNASAKYSIDGRNVDINAFTQPAAAAAKCSPTTAVNCVIGSGSGSDSAVTSATTSVAGYVVPQEWLKQKVNADADYRLLPQSDTKLTLGYQFDDTERSNAQVGRSYTNTGTIGLSSRLGSDFMGRVSYAYGDRSGVLNYWVPWANLDGNNGSSADPSAAYYQAPMTSNAVNLRGDYAPGGAFSGGLSFKWENDDFHYPSTTSPMNPSLAAANIPNQVEGVKQDWNLTAGVDGNYQPAEGLNVHVYYTYEQIFFNNLGNGSCATAAAAITTVCGGTGTAAGTDPGYFQNKETTGVHTVGFNTDWQATDKLKLTAGYTFAYGAVMFGEYDGVFVTSGTETATNQNVINYPDENTIMHNVSLKGTYQLTANTELSLAGMYSMFRMSNWQDLTSAVVADCSAATCATGSPNTIDFLTPGYSSPNYNVAAVMAAVKVKW